MILDSYRGPPFSLEFVLVEIDFLYMTQLIEERARSRLHHIPFNYYIYHYSSRLVDYFVRDLKPLFHLEGLIDELIDI